MTRREALASVVGVPLLPWSSSAQQPPDHARLESVTEHVKLYRDVINVGLIRKNGKSLLIDSGENFFLRGKGALAPKSIEWVLYTHYHRDQCSGADALKKAGAKIVVSATEAAFFRNATERWLAADRILDHRYNLRPDLFMLRESVVPDRELKPGEVFEWEGQKIHVVPTPGHTDGSVSYVVEDDGKQIAFVGDLIAGPGQLWNFYSLQKGLGGMPGDYWGFGGAVPDVVKSLDEILAHRPTLLIPSHGVVMKDPRQAAALLRSRLSSVMKNYLTTCTVRYDRPDWHMDQHMCPGVSVPRMAPLPPVKLPAWLHKIKGSTSAYLRAGDGLIFLFDAAFCALEEDVARLVKSKEISGVDAVWISHYHDDHVQSVNEIRRKYGARVYAQKELQDILENPRAYSMPCLFPESIHLDHVLSEGEVINWNGYKITGFYFPGQTLYHDALLIEHEGTRVFMVGDSTYNWAIDDYCSQNRNFLGSGVGYERCLRLLLRIRPDMLWPAHRTGEPFSEEYLQKTLDLLQERTNMFTAIFPWDDPNFGLDPNWVRAYPYRQNILSGQLVTFEARIYNHSAHVESASVELRAPAGWKTYKSVPVSLAPKSEGKVTLTGVAPKNPHQRREVLGLAVEFGGRSLGEAAEAIVDYLG
jgi:glyoxylase-like metal-dependent hydrolase (beta-lactamase superfamily II)